MRIKQRPYNLLLVTAIPLAISGVLGLNKTFDIHLHDTYFIMPLAFFTLIPSMILLVVWFLYVLTKNYLFSNKLAWLHIIISIIFSLFISALPYLATYSWFAGAPRRYYDNTASNGFKIFDNLPEIVVPAFLMLSTAQLLFLINLLIGLSKRTGK